MGDMINVDSGCCGGMDLANYSSRVGPTAYSSRPEMSRSKTILPLVGDKNYHKYINKSYSAGIPQMNSYYCEGNNGVYQRFTHGDWDNDNRKHFWNADTDKGLSDRIRSDAYRAIQETDSRTRNRQAEVNRKLSERVQDISFWKCELNNELRAMETEMENLAEHQRVLEKSLQDTAAPLQIAEECLMQREKRSGIDRVHDDVEKALCREIALIKKCQDRMKKMLNKAEVQQKMNRSAMHEMEKDVRDKNGAHGIDDRMHQLRNTSGEIGFHEGIECFDNTVTNTETWTKFTQTNIYRSQKERENSEKTRGDIDALRRQCSNEMWHMFNAVNNAFNARIQESNDARNKLQAHLNKTNQAIFDMQKNIALLKRALAAKEAPLKVAETRLEERTRRPNVEVCHDNPMKSLIKEVCEIKDSVKYLRDRLRQAEAALSRLLKTKGQLESEISNKENSLGIDAKACMGMRKAFPMDPNLGPIFTMPLTGLQNCGFQNANCC